MDACLQLLRVYCPFPLLFRSSEAMLREYLMQFIPKYDQCR